MVGSWEVVIATLHTDLVHNLLVPLMSYVSIKPSSSSPLGGRALGNALLNGVGVGGWIELQITATRLWRSMRR